MEKLPLGIQLYTVRNELKDDFTGTLEKVAEMGFEAAEFGSDFGGMDPAEVAKFVRGLGMATCGVHGGVFQLQDPSSVVYAYAEALGSDYVTTGLLAEVHTDWPAAMDNVRKAADTAHSKGFTFTYHNHAEELDTVDGRVALDALFETSDPDKVHFELDTYWIKKGGYDPVAYICNYAGRVPQVHLKDMDAETGTFTEIGEGIMDLDAIYAAAREAGVRWMIYEQDRWERPPLESCRLSIENLRRAGLA